ncbi:MAG: TrmH family RNA methyltransferase [Actinomycetota bacterium]
MDDGPITSTANPLVRRLRKLRHRKYRDLDGSFLIEGIAHVRRAVEHEAPIEMILVAPDLLTSEGAWTMVESQRRAGQRIVELGREAFETIVERDHPSGLAATVVSARPPVTDLVAGPGSVFVGLHDVGNPGNLGSIVRTVDAIGGAGVVIVGDSTDPQHPAAVKASMGTLFTVPVVYAKTLEDLVGWCLMDEVRLITTSVRAEHLIWDVRFELPSLFLFGSEAVGLPPDVVARGHASVRLPMHGAASSLNLAVAAGAVLYEVERQRRLT